MEVHKQVCGCNGKKLHIWKRDA